MSLHMFRFSRGIWHPRRQYHNSANDSQPSSYRIGLTLIPSRRTQSSVAEDRKSNRSQPHPSRNGSLFGRDAPDTDEPTGISRKRREIPVIAFGTH